MRLRLTRGGLTQGRELCTAVCVWDLTSTLPFSPPGDGGSGQVTLITRQRKRQALPFPLPEHSRLEVELLLELRRRRRRREGRPDRPRRPPR